MEQLLYILPRALAIGVLISAPMGPIGMLVIQRTLSKGRWPAFFTGIGAALSDLIYCLLAGLSISFVTDLITAHQAILQVAGGVVLAVFGMFLFRKNPTRTLKSVGNMQATTYWKDFVTGFFLTFSNPLILFFIIGLFGQFNFVLSEYKFFHYVCAYIAIVAGALLWWYIVTTLVDKLRSRINVRSLWLINRLIGTILIIIAIFGIVEALMR